MEGQQFVALQDIATRIDRFFASKYDLAPYIGQQSMLNDMRTRYHEGDTDGALLISQSLINFLETQETLLVQTEQTQNDIYIQQSLQQELTQITQPESESKDFWKIFFMSILLLSLGVYIRTWRDIMLVWVGVGAIGMVIVRYMK